MEPFAIRSNDKRRLQEHYPVIRPLARKSSRPAGALHCRVWIYRQHKHMTQQDLARLAQVSRRTMHAVETGKTVPSILLALRVAFILDEPVETLFRLR